MVKGSMSMEYRLLKPNDVLSHQTEMISLMEIVLADNITQEYPSDQAAVYVGKISGYIEDGSAIVSGAFINKHLVGFSWAYELSIFGERRVHIDMIGVDPEYRRQGIARNLIDIQIEEIRKRDIHIIEAMTTKGNLNSYNWFHSMGFTDERVKVRKDLR